MPVTIKTVHRKVWAQIERYAASWIGVYHGGFDTMFSFCVYFE